MVRQAPDDDLLPLGVQEEIDADQVLSVMAAFDNPYLTPPALPTTFFIDQSGHLIKVVKGSHNYDQWCDEIDKLL